MNSGAYTDLGKGDDWYQPLDFSTYDDAASTLNGYPLEIIG